MDCPVDGTPLAMSERQGIEIDYCPTCRGVWLDRGEIDKIIERTNAEAETTTGPRDRDHDDRQVGWSEHGGHGKRRKRSFLSEMFEGD